MKTYNLAVLCLAFSLTSCATRPVTTTNLLPGITYYRGSEKLTGKLVFLLSHNAGGVQNDQKSAAIYEFNVGTGTLRKVTDAPKGSLSVSHDGDLSSVVFWRKVGRTENSTNAFIHSSRTGQHRILHLPAPPVQTVAVGGHVFFYLHEYPNKGLVTNRLLDFDMARNETQWVELPGAAKWEGHGFWAPFAPSGQTNILQFHYSPGGKRISDGRDYKPGLYSLNVDTGNVQFVPSREEVMAGREPVAFNGRRVFFTGPGSPDTGYELVLSPWNRFWTKEYDPKGHEVKVLHRFPKRMGPFGGKYILRGLSPCGRFALVRYVEETTRRSVTLPGWINIYYLVDVSTGNTRVLLRDTVDGVTSGSMSPLHWVQVLR